MKNGTCRCVSFFRRGGIHFWPIIFSAKDRDRELSVVGCNCEWHNCESVKDWNGTRMRVDREWWWEQRGAKRRSMGWSLVYGRRETARTSLLREDEFAEFVDIDVETSEYGITWDSISRARQHARVNNYGSLIYLFRGIFIFIKRTIDTRFIYDGEIQGHIYIAIGSLILIKICTNFIQISNFYTLRYIFMILTKLWIIMNCDFYEFTFLWKQTTE